VTTCQRRKKNEAALRVLLGDQKRLSTDVNREKILQRTEAFRLHLPKVLERSRALSSGGVFPLMRMLDLYSGLGGASQAFVNDDQWSVHRIEKSRLMAEVEFTTIQDAMKVKPELNQYDLIWASPPCRDFSDACDSPKSVARRERQSYEPDMSLLLKAIDIIETVKPKWWVIENVRGAQEYFTPLIGSVRQKVGPFYLWGKFPILTGLRSLEHEKKDNDTWSTDPIRTQRLAMIPYEISHSLLMAIRHQRRLDEFAPIILE